MIYYINNYSTSSRWICDGRAISISYLTNAGGIILLKTPTKYGEFFPTFFVKTTDFQLVFNFEQTRTVTLFGEHGIIAHVP